MLGNSISMLVSFIAGVQSLILASLKKCHTGPNKYNIQHNSQTWKIDFIHVSTVKPCVKRTLKNRQNKGLNDK